MTASKLLVRAVSRDDVAILLVDGVLDSSTYRQLRDNIIKAALDEPRAVVVNVSALRVPVPSALSVFTSARWQVSCWPDVPVLLVCGYLAGRDALRRHGITRYVPAYESLEAAIATLEGAGPRIRMRRFAELPVEGGCARAIDLVTEWLWDWDRGAEIREAKAIVAELVDNVLTHTDSAPMLRVESDGWAVTIAVSDRCRRLPARLEMTHDTFRLTGLHLVTALADSWGCAPTSDGKTVWATLRARH
jgi:hypothetical protein